MTTESHHRQSPIANRQSPSPSLVPGFHAVRETLTQGAGAVQEIWIASGRKMARMDEIRRMAMERGIPVLFKEPEVFARHFPGVGHQGIAALIPAFTYADLDQIAQQALQGDGWGLILVADHITDQGNLGALIRTAAFFNVHGIVIPEDRSARVDPAMLKRSAGAYAHVPVARVVNIGRTLDLLSKKGFWIIGTSGDAPVSIYQFDWNRHVVLVMGNEQKGLTRPAQKSCHEIVSIPVHGAVASLNVSVSAGVVLSEIVRQRST